MSEAEAIEALTNIGETAGAFYSMWISVTFAYLTVAYLVGQSLTRFQTLAISAIYIFAAWVFGSSAQGYAGSWNRLSLRENTILSESWVFSATPYHGETTAVLVVGGTLLSLYFMHNIRARKLA